MDITALLLEAGNLMLVGMISVFLFLGLLVIVVQTMAKYCPADIPAAAKKPAAQPTNNTLNPKLIAAITSAVQQYRDNK
ncbi:oxaloacetate decarboxylase subunit gamma [Motilimonas eburnea]|uniref:oxaloacetate decarboxylase subunit gamma n=1 Tax=Motilimonas eburnea TaxID=1737488 RepID=UPI001E2F9776|nr:oxaloacetate decarboxylase subunit gamma [Motilimonas eburnea]MCE2571411.1 oxaloacetate decarboxylase subunit gamma [Motilimonas eburnea]